MLSKTNKISLIYLHYYMLLINKFIIVTINNRKNYKLLINIRKICQSLDIFEWVHSWGVVHAHI
jgi:hypothetical protein